MSREQVRNKYAILVQFPDQWPDAPDLAGRIITFYYPTLVAAEFAAKGFRTRGAFA